MNWGIIALIIAILILGITFIISIKTKLLFSPLVIGISTCQDINSPGEYVLVNNLETDGSCIIITSDNVNLDLNGFSITGTNLSSGNFGIDVRNVSSVMIQNGSIFGFYIGVVFTGDWYGSDEVGENNILKDIYVSSSNGTGISVQTQENLTMDSVISFNNSGRGFYFDSVYNSRFLRLNASSNGILTTINSRSSAVFFVFSSNNFLSDIVIDKNVNEGSWSAGESLFPIQRVGMEIQYSSNFIIRNISFLENRFLIKDQSYNNSISNLVFSDNSFSYPLVIAGAANNTFLDSNFSIVNGSVWIYSTRSVNSTGNVFLNFNYNTSRESLTYGYSELARKWRVVFEISDDSGAGIPGASVSVSDRNENPAFSGVTGSDGKARGILNEYVYSNAGGSPVRTYFSNYLARTSVNGREILREFNLTRDMTISLTRLPEGAIRISNCNELQNIDLNLTANYFLGNNIDCSDTKNWNNGAGFEPIGNSTDSFTGIFEGNNYIISNLYINNASRDYAGLFKDVAGNIYNVGLVGVNVSGRSFTGGLASSQNSGTISNSYSTGSVTGFFSVGGLVGGAAGVILNSYSSADVIGSDNRAGGLAGTIGVGRVENSHATGSVIGVREESGGLVGRFNSGIINNSYSTGSVNGDDVVGGLVGLQNSGTISNSHAAGGVKSDGMAGGLVGWQISGTISKSYSTGNLEGYGAIGGLVGATGRGNISASYSTGNVLGNQSVGGLVGEQDLGAISNSYSTGSVTGRIEYTGGLVGLQDFGAQIINSYSTGSVTGVNYTGGLVGWGSGNISNSYSTGSVTGVNYTRGLVGVLDWGNIFNSYWYSPGVSDCYWYTDNFGNPVSYGNDNCTKASGASYFYTITNAPMDSWDFDSVWDDVYNGINFPVFIWQNISYTAPTPPDNGGNNGGGGGSSGGGGGGTPPRVCSENWACSGWSECVDDVQTRVCSDKNNCRTTANKPSIRQSCVEILGAGNQSGRGETGGVIENINLNWKLILLIGGIAIVGGLIVLVIYMRRGKSGASDRILQMRQAYRAGAENTNKD